MAKTEKHETPTFETLEKGQWREDYLDATAGSRRRLRRLDGDALDKALLDKLITIDEHTTLEDFRSQLYKAGLVFCPRAGLDVAGTSGQGQFMADRAFSRAKMISQQMDAVAQALTAAQLNDVLAVLTMDQRVTKDMAETMSSAARALDKFHGRI